MKTDNPNNPLLSTFAPVAHWQMTLAVILAYILLFFALYPLIGWGVIAWVMLPVAMIGWMYGVMAGGTAGLLALPLNTLLLNLSGESGIDVVFQVGGLSVSTGVILLGLLTGMFHSMYRKLYAQLGENQNARQETSLLESRFRTLAENIDEIVWMTSPDGKETLYVNPAYESITGYPTKTLYDAPQSWHTLIHPEDKQHVQNRLQTEHPTLVTLEYRIVRKDGGVRWIWHRVKSVKDAKDAVITRIITAQDITERIVIEDQAMELTLQKERAEILEKLIRNVSHDFRTPLSNINISLYMLKKTKDEVDQNKRAEIISEEVERIKTLVDDMLAMIRIDKDNLSFQPLNLHEILHEVKERLDALPRKRKITITLILEEKVPELVGDQGQITMAISHLLMYMMLYSMDGAEIFVRTESDRTYTTISVNDPDIGISADKLERVFEPFYKIESVRTTAVGRSGLGLAMTKKIIERHGGSLSVESDEDGTGSVFKILLPVKRPEFTHKSILEE